LFPNVVSYRKDAGQEIIILLCGGNKSTQQRDIERAKKIALEPLREENDGNRAFPKTRLVLGKA
jgi:hypothetical protein